MRKAGCRCEFAAERDAEVRRAFRDFMVAGTPGSCSHIYQITGASPSSRFWVSETRAERVLRRMAKGDPLNEMIPTRRRMFFEIFSRVQILLSARPCLSIADAIFRVVNSEAPEFYLTERTIRKIINDKP